eukprot:CAMPEP_0181369658 /NCGR_PEP_ID=MMETSP1106-20121128/12923_1 /TAXON_ID=81844 /ORGANISM="Mantoniella antarctica, Strain SL-175" /LENGTH=463 /DNA_ID=CAMNT_0023486225 /DNA_START=287 /DNA_END=1678 /DNA_ORIENTATION=-
MSTCAGCGKALDRSDGQGRARECPNCKAGESIQGRHFYCSKTCFTSSWQAHRKLHVRVRRTTTLSLPDHLLLRVRWGNQDEQVPVADFGLMTDREWRDYQASPGFAATVEQGQEALAQRRQIESDTYEGAKQDYINRGMEASFLTNLDVVCSMKKFSVEEMYTAMCAVSMAIHNAGIEQTSVSMMFEIIRRNYLYQVSIVALEPQRRMNLEQGHLYQEDVRRKLHLMKCSPVFIFSECFSERINYEDVHINVETNIESEALLDKGENRLDAAYELVCPMYVCAFVAMLLHQMWDNRLSIIVGNEDGDASSSSSLSSVVPTVSATSARIVKGPITVEERVKLSAGLVRILGRALPSFHNLQSRPRGCLKFREFLRGVNGRGSREARKLITLEKACRQAHPLSTESMDAGQMDLAAAEALHLTAQLCLGVAAAHGCDKATHAELLDDCGLVRWALQKWEKTKRGG